MIQKLSKQGDRLVLEIDRALLDQLQIDETTALEVTTDGRTLSIAPMSWTRSNAKSSRQR